MFSQSRLNKRFNVIFRLKRVRSSFKGERLELNFDSRVPIHTIIFIKKKQLKKSSNQKSSEIILT